MGSALSLRSDFDGVRLRRLARQTRDADQARRLLSLASIYCWRPDDLRNQPFGPQYLLKRRQLVRQNACREPASSNFLGSRLARQGAKRLTFGCRSNRVKSSPSWPSLSDLQ